MVRRSIFLTSFALLAGASCTNDRSSVAAPADGQALTLARAHEDDDDDDKGDGRFQKLVAITGPGHGQFRGTRIPHTTTPGNFAIHVEAKLRGAKANTTYILQRAPDTFSPPGPPAGFDLATLTDGSCQRALAIAPWTTLVPAPAAFVSWTPTLVTDKHGNGDIDFNFEAAFPLPDFDVMFRVIESGVAPKSVFLTECTTLRR